MAGNAQEKTDSVKVVELAKVLQEKTAQNKKLMEENKKIQQENENLLEIVLLKLRKLIGSRSTIEKQEKNVFFQNNQGTKAENRTDPVEEIEIYDGADTIRGGWFYRLFHKNDFYYKRYKLVDNEKVYLD
ncbi:hypothetical protein [uncultured Chryseobacterium sp.]|uniref:hypothetical protein n=1 Tax=uncultured Chryseobacterium sp. TaxID=259322 RepID=UPI0025F6AED3|nr:hypothetical protein [uncultured Chryseobacterium sp.]